MIRCEFEHASIAFLRHVTVDTVVHDEEDRVLLVRRALHLGEGGKLALPGGYLDRDERIVDGARREVLEETGYSIGEISLLTISDDPLRPGDDRQNVSFVHAARAIEQVQQPDNESTEIGWYRLEQLAHEAIAFDHRDYIEMWFRSRSTK